MARPVRPPGKKSLNPEPSPSNAAKATSASTSRPSSTTRTSRRNSSRIASKSIADSEESDDDETVASLEQKEEPEEPSSQRRSKRLLKEVAIRQMAPSSNTKKASTPLSSFNNSANTSRYGSADHDTPLTSMSNTPVYGSSRRSARTNQASNGKRGKSAFIADSDEDQKPSTDGDAALALALQEDEYDWPIPSTKRAKPSFSLELDEDDDGELSEVPSEDVAPPRKKARTGRRTAAKKSRKSITKMTVVDTDDEEDEDFMELDADLDDASEADEVSGESDQSEKIPSPPRKAAGRRKNHQAATGSKTKKPLSFQERKAKKEEAMRMKKMFRHLNKWERRKAINRHKLETNHPNLVTIWQDLEKIPVIQPVAAEQPDSITRKLKSFQLEGLDWMTRQEKTKYQGGLLGDEMGMGKTIQAVSLIMSDYPVKVPTLVVVPPVALMQWQTEIKEYTNGKLKVLVFHQTNSKTKNMKVAQLKQYDVIIISYNTLESMYRKQTKGWSRGDNLVKEASSIHSIKFHRLILDEAHSIKTRTTGVARACFALEGRYKWCLSGTPVQNRIGEFFSLLRFLEVRPFADYFCRSCKCEQLHWSLTDESLCSECGHGGSEHVSVFNQELLNPITGDDVDLRGDALEQLHMITARMMLRRMKVDYTSSMELPPKEVIIHNEFFGEEERDFSSSIMTNSSRKFDTYVAQGVMLNNYANIFGLIMQMRQVANHPDLLLKKHADGGQNILICNLCDEPAEEPVRSRCRHEFCRSCIKSFIRTAEGSGASADCPRCHITLAIDLEQPDIVEQDEDLVKKSSIVNRIKMENWTSSTKIEMLVYDLYKLRSKKQTTKSIVFSQFTSMLQLIEWRLRRAGFNTVMLDGSMSPAQRQKSIEYFMNNADVEVFLVSLKAGGVALNLTEASRVFIVDPWWNPAAEWQSADRCHRIGQKRPCVITRLCIEDSVESRMVQLQEKKAALIASTVNNDKVAMDKLSPEDLQFLFRGS